MLSFITLLPWLILPFVQKKSRYFYYFLVLALAGFYQMVMVNVSLIKYLMLLMMPSAVLLIPSLFKNFIQQKKLFVFLILALLIIISSFLNHLTNQVIALISFIIVLIILSYHVMLDMINNNKINIVWMTIVIYQLSLVIKFIPFLRDFTTGITYFYLTTIFQMFIGIFFIFAKEDNPKLIITLK